MQDTPRNNEYLLPFIILGLFITTGVFVFLVYRSFFWTSFISLLFYIATRDYYQRLQKKIPDRFSSLSAWIMIFLVLMVVGVPLFIISRTLVSEILSLLFIIKLNLSEDKILIRLMDFPMLMDFITNNEFFWVDIPDFYREIVGSYGDVLNVDSLYGIFSNAASLILGGIRLPIGFFANLLFGILLLFFFYKDGPKLEHFLLMILPLSEEIREKIGIRVSDAMKTIVKGNIFISLLQGGTLGFLMFLVGIPSPLLYGSIAAFFSMIPVIGTMVVWLPAGLYLGLIEGNWLVAIIFMSLAFAFYLGYENFLKPTILDRKLHIHPFLLFLALLGGIKEFGIAGLIIGPIAVTLIVILWDFWLSYRVNHPNQTILEIIKNRSKES